MAFSQCATVFKHFLQNTGQQGFSVKVTTQDIASGLVCAKARHHIINRDTQCNHSLAYLLVGGYTCQAYHCFNNPFNRWHVNVRTLRKIDGHVVVTEQFHGGAGDQLQSRLRLSTGHGDGEQLSPMVLRPLSGHLDATTVVASLIAVRHDHPKVHRLHRKRVPCDLLSHVVEGAVDVRALAKVGDRVDVPEEFFTAGDPAEDLVVLGEVEASHGPAELDAIGVGLVLQSHGEVLGELFDTRHHAARGLLQQRHGLGSVQDEEHVDRTHDFFCWGGYHF